MTFQTKPSFPQQAIILAGGFGTRLQSVVRDVPKPMAAINGRPFLCHLLDYCAKYGIQKIVLAVGYRHEVIEQYFGSEYRGMEIHYSVENEPLGTGGAIKEAMDYTDANTAVFVLNGDTLFAADLQQLYNVYQQNNADIALALCQLQNFDRYGVVASDEKGRVTAFCEKQFCSNGNINGGIYVLSNRLLQNFPPKFSFEKDVLEAGINTYRIYAQANNAYFIDIGIPEDYARAMQELC